MIEMIVVNGNKYWIKDKHHYHREDGPAVELLTKDFYYIEGVSVSKEEYPYKIHKYKLRENTI
jgi:hypothetical protein